MSRQQRNTLRHLEKGWVPVHEAFLAQIQENLEQGLYRENPEALLSDLKQDPALLLYCLKNLPSVLDEEEVSDAKTPFEHLRTLEEEQLCELLNVPPEEISHHKRRKATPTQQTRDRITRVSGQAAERIAAAVSVSEEDALTSTLLRQIGHDLLAWNYPRIYSRALNQHGNSNETLDRALRSVLGVTPIELGRKYAHDWHLGREIEQALRPEPEQSPDEEDESEELQHSKLQISLQQVNELSELFAKAQEPATFETAQDVWAAKGDVLGTIFGQELISNLKTVAQSITAEESPSSTLSPPKDLKEHEESTSPLEPLYRKNRYLEKLPEQVAASFLKAYAQIEEARLSLDSIRTLVEQAAPAAGFTRGCLYLQDKHTLDLKPALRIGEKPLQAYKRFLLDGRNGVLSALHSQAPIREEGVGIKGEPATQICGSLQNRIHPGVLYLEVDDDLSEDPEYDSLHSFHAIREALNHCFAGDGLPVEEKVQPED